MNSMYMYIFTLALLQGTFIGFINECVYELNTAGQRDDRLADRRLCPFGSPGTPSLVDEK